MVPLIVFALLIAAVVYGRTLFFLLQRGGRVDAGRFSLPDLFTASMLVVIIAGLMAKVLLLYRGVPPEVSVDNVLPEQFSVMLLVAGIAAFLSWRGLKIGHVFGLRNLPAGATLAAALLFIVAAFPIVSAVNYLSLLMLRKMAAEQQLVELFRDLSQAHDYGAMGKVLLAAVVIAPVCEEFLFRGYFYGVGKRYLGALPSAVAASLLFAAVHLNLASLPGLFVLALCLTAAYERTGSLLVPIGMHALYNFTSLLVLYFEAGDKLPIPAP